MIRSKREKKGEGEERKVRGREGKKESVNGEGKEDT